MGPKSKKLKISMKDLLSKQGNEDQKTEADHHLGDIHNDAPHFENKETDENSKKSEKSNQDSKKNAKKKVQADVKKEVSLKAMMKQATSEIFDERKKSTFFQEAAQAISAENSSIRLLSLFQVIHANYFKVFNVFKTNGHQEMEKILSRFSTRLSDVLREQKDTKQLQISSKKNDSKEDFSSKWIHYYNMELKLKDDEIKRKKAFRDNTKTKFQTQIQNIQIYITQNARIINQIVLRERFQTIIDKVVVFNSDIVAKKARQTERVQKSLFFEWRKMKQESKMKEKIKRASKMEKMENCRRILADKFPNLMGVLITPFTIFERVK